MTQTNTAASLISTVAASRNRFLALAANLTPAQAAFKPSPAQWSILENLEHLVLAEVSGVSKIWQAADDRRSNLQSPLASHQVTPHENDGLSIEAVVARTWKAQEVAPPIATPHIGGPLAYWIVYFQACQPILDALIPVLEGLDLETVTYPHFLSGILNARQRLEFLRFHIDRHIGQITRVMASPEYPVHG